MKGGCGVVKLNLWRERGIKETGGRTTPQSKHLKRLFSWNNDILSQHLICSFGSLANKSERDPTRELWGGGDYTLNWLGRMKSLVYNSSILSLSKDTNHKRVLACRPRILLCCQHSRLDTSHKQGRRNTKRHLDWVFTFTHLPCTDIWIYSGSNNLSLYFVSVLYCSSKYPATWWCLAFYVCRCCPHDFMKTTHGAVDDDNNDYDVI